MSNYFTGDKKGRIASENNEDKIATIIKSRYEKLCIKLEGKKISDKEKEKIDKYNEYLRNCIEERVRDNSEE